MKAIPTQRFAGPGWAPAFATVLACVLAACPAAWAQASGQTVTVGGKAVTTAGKPVPGVKVTITATAVGRAAGSWTVVSDSAGKFAVEVPASAARGLSVGVEAPAAGSFAPFAIMPPSGLRALRGPPPPITILMAPATCRLAGKVTDEDGKPVAGATVTLAAGQGPGGSGWLKRSAVSDKAGRYELARLAAGRYSIASVDPPAGTPLIRLYTWKPWGVRAVALAKDAATEDFRLPKGARLIGRVLGEDGKGIEGATASCRLDAATEVGKASVYQVPGQWYSGSTQTDAQGRYVLGGLTQETYSVHIEPPAARELAPAVVRGISAPKATDVPVQDVTLHQSGTLVGTVTGHDGKGVGGAAVSVTPATRGGEAHSATADARGGFVLTGLPTGMHSVTVRPPAGSTLCEGVFRDVAVIGGLSLTHSMKLVEGARLSGKVTDPAGKPVAGVSITVRCGYSQRASAVTGADGKYRLAGLSEPARTGPAPRRGGGWQLLARPPETRPLLVSTSAKLEGLTVGAARTLDVRMKAGVAIAGVVTGPGGKLVAGCLVAATRRVGRGGYTSTGGARTGPDGRYKLGHVAAEKWSVAVLPQPDSGLLAKAMPSRSFPAGKTTEVNVALAPGATIAGRAVTSAGAPAVGAVIRLEEPRRSDRVWVPGVNQGQRQAHADARGSFLFKGVPPGKVKLYCTPQDPQQRADITEVNVSGSGEHEVTIKVYGTGTVHGYLRDTAGKALPRGAAYVTLERADGTAGRAQRGYCDDQGRYSIAGILPGKYSLTVKLNRRGQDMGLKPPAPRAVVVMERRQLKIDLKVSAGR